jgi:excinuclease ABC subunit C
MIEINHIPHEPWIYIFKDSVWNILYIGKAKNLQKRVQQYFSPGSVWKQEMVHRAKTIDYVCVYNESEALYLESNLIKKHQPIFNNLLKDNQNYCFIRISHEDFWQISIVRKRYEDKAIYIWPKHQRQVVKEFMQYLRQILKFRTSKAAEFKSGKLGTDFYFWLEKWRSVIAKLKQKNAQYYIDEAARHGLVIDKTYEEYKTEYAHIINLITSFFAGNTKPIEQEIRRQIDEAIAKQHFERAAKLRDIYVKIDSLVEKQRVVVEQSISGFVAMAKEMSWWTVFAIFSLYEWRIIDIIRHKQKAEDLDMAAFVAMIENQYGAVKIYADDCKKELEDLHSYTDWSLFLVDTKIKKIKKKTLTELHKLVQKSIEDFVQASSFEKESLMNDVLKTIETRYGLNQFPYRIECIDISHLSGWWMSGGLSCLVWWIPMTKWYRRYKIKTVKTLDQQNNDYKALEEVLTRRFSKDNPSEKPNICIIDWGKWQLGVVQKLLASNKEFMAEAKDIQFVALGKGDARKRKGKNDGAKEELLVLTDKVVKHYDFTYDDSDRILIKARDESHRFANAYRKKQMQKEWK